MANRTDSMHAGALGEEEWFHVLYDAEEGDRILFKDRVQPLTVQDVGTKDDGRRYINAIGPRGGGPYHIVEDYNVEGYPKPHVESTGEPVTGLRFAERWYRREDSAEGSRISREEAEALAREAAHEAMHAYENLSYDNMLSAAEDVAQQTVDTIGVGGVRGVLHTFYDDITPEDPRYIKPDVDAARDALVAAIADRVPERPIGGGEPTIATRADYEALVNELTTRLRAMREEAGEKAADARSVARDAVGGMPPSDWAQVVSFATVGGLPMYLVDQRDELRNQATNLLSRDVAREWAERQEEALRSKTGAVFRDAEEFLEDAVGERMSWEEFKRTIGRTPAQIHERLDERGLVPRLADGGAPHTLIDEMTGIYKLDVLMRFDNWRLADPGIVVDGASRYAIWVNDRTNEALALVGMVPESLPVDLQRVLGKWTVWYKSHDKVVQTDGGAETMPGQVKPLHSTDSLPDAARFVKEFMSEGEEANLRILERDDGFVVVQEDIDYDEAGKRLFRKSGWTLPATDIDVPVPTAELPKAAGRAAGRGVLAGLRGGASLAGRGVKFGGKVVWHNWKNHIAGAVQFVLAYMAASGAGLLPFAETELIWNPEEMGVHVAVVKEPEQSDEDEAMGKVGRRTLFEFEHTVPRQPFAERYGIGRGVTWALGLVDDDKADSIKKDIMDGAFESTFLLGGSAAAERMVSAFRETPEDVRDVGVETPDGDDKKKKGKKRRKKQRDKEPESKSYDVWLAEKGVPVETEVERFEGEERVEDTTEELMEEVRSLSAWREEHPGPGSDDLTDEQEAELRDVLREEGDDHLVDVDPELFEHLFDADRQSMVEGMHEDEVPDLDEGDEPPETNGYFGLPPGDDAIIEQQREEIREKWGIDPDEDDDFDRDPDAPGQFWPEDRYANDYDLSEYEDWEGDDTDPAEDDTL